MSVTREYHHHTPDNYIVFYETIVMMQRFYSNVV